MKHLLQAIAIASLALPCALSAQTPATPAAPTSNGPTLEQTVQFLNERLAVQPPIGALLHQSFKNDSCLLISRIESTRSWLSQYYESPIPTTVLLVAFDLSRSDPLSISINDGSDVGAQSGTFVVTAERAMANYQAFQTTSASPIPVKTGQPQYAYDGIVHSVTSDAINFILVDDSHSPFLPLFISSFPVDARTTYWQLTDGKRKKVKASAMELKPGDYVKLGYEYDGSQNTVERISVGNPIPKIPVTQPEVLLPETRQLHNTSVSLLYSSDKSEAERMAKAIIHAIALCQKDKPASLF